jgi:hypothetical protein
MAVLKMRVFPARLSSAHLNVLPAELQHFRSDNSEKRFTQDGSPALEQELKTLCDRVLGGVQSVLPAKKLQALVLGGGYGRGQGGVLRTDDTDQPYNDLEFYVFLRGHRVWNERKFSPALNQLGERLSRDVDLHVEFKIDSLARLRRSPVTMFSYDLVCGHRILFAPDGDFAGCEAHQDATRIPLSEATRLLFNRCTGLLLAQERLQRENLSADECDFIGRNLAKAQLALGDVVLTDAGQYHWNCLERHERLKRFSDFEKMPWLSEVKRHHANGVDFKLHPQRIRKSHRQFITEQVEISSLARQLWLWLESRRLGERFSTARDYAFSARRKCEGGGMVRNLLLNARTFGARSVFDPLALRYPRERLLNSLPLLLWETPLNDLRVKRHLRKQLRTSASDWQGFVAAYKSFWPAFS